MGESRPIRRSKQYESLRKAGRTFSAASSERWPDDEIRADALPPKAIDLVEIRLTICGL